MELKIKSDSGRIPKYATEHSAGMDLSAFLPESEFVNGEFVLKAGMRALVPTGIYIELPMGYEAQVREIGRAHV